MQKKEERQSKQKSEEELPMEKLTAHCAVMRNAFSWVFNSLWCTSLNWQH